MAWSHCMLIVVVVALVRPRRRLGDDACVGLGYAVAALVNYGIGAARRAAWSCRGGSSKQSFSMALGGLLLVRLVCKTLSFCTRSRNLFFPSRGAPLTPDAFARSLANCLVRVIRALPQPQQDRIWRRFRNYEIYLA